VSRRKIPFSALMDDADLKRGARQRRGGRPQSRNRKAKPLLEARQKTALEQAQDAGEVRKPKKVVPEAQLVEGMATVGATNVEIADFLLISEDQLTRKYADILQKARAGRNVLLRKLQWRAAKAGSAAMLIWLGKQYLGQREIAKLEIDWGTLTDDELREIEQGKIPDRLLAKAKQIT
jgi:hypothetical protein